jgi:hypothetical protein
MPIATNLQFGTGNGTSLNAPRDGKIGRVLDISLNSLGAGIVSGDQIHIDRAPAKSKVIFHRVANNTVLTTGTSAAIYIGDTSVTSRFVSNSALNTAGAVHALVTGANTTGQVYETATDITLTLIRSSGTAVAGKIDLVYEIIPLNPVEGPRSF